MKLWTNWFLTLAGSFSVVNIIAIVYGVELYAIAAMTLTALVCLVLGVLIERNDYE